MCLTQSSTYYIFIREMDNRFLRKDNAKITTFIGYYSSSSVTRVNMEEAIKSFNMPEINSVNRNLQKELNIRSIEE